MGDGMRKTARALYERAGEEEKKEAKKFFKKLDLNKDERISLSEFKKGVAPELANNKVFKELESNRNRGLDFDDVLVLFYYNVKHTITIIRCHGCRHLIFGPSFSCFQCMFNPSDRRFALCCDCYGKGEVKHQHPLSSMSTSTAGDLLHDRALVLKLSEMMKSHQPRSKKEMKKLWEDAKSETGAAASREAEAMADNLIKSMGDDGQNQGLDLKHFSELMIQQESALDKFLKPSEDSEFATNFMKSELKRVLTQSTTPTTAIVAHNNVATTSTLRSHFVNTANYRRDSGESSSKAIFPISPLKVATTTFKLLDMALTIASLSSMCTIMCDLLNLLVIRL